MKKICTGEYWKWKGQSCIHDLVTPLLTRHTNNQSLDSSYDLGAWTKTHFLMAESILHRTLSHRYMLQRKVNSTWWACRWKNKESLEIASCLLTIQSQETLQDSRGGGIWEICRRWISTQSIRNWCVRALQTKESLLRTLNPHIITPFWHHFKNKSKTRGTEVTESSKKVSWFKPS